MSHDEVLDPARPAPRSDAARPAMVRSYAELFDCEPLRLITFPNDEGHDELVLVCDIPFRTVCEHHVLPFFGVAHVGYLPGERIVGLSKLARVVQYRAGRRRKSGSPSRWRTS
jgi:GTP cyclohydrolase I